MSNKLTGMTQTEATIWAGVLGKLTSDAPWFWQVRQNVKNIPDAWSVVRFVGDKPSVELYTSEAVGRYIYEHLRERPHYVWTWED